MASLALAGCLAVSGCSDAPELQVESAGAGTGLAYTVGTKEVSADETDHICATAATELTDITFVHLEGLTVTDFGFTERNVDLNWEGPAGSAVDPSTRSIPLCPSGPDQATYYVSFRLTGEGPAYASGPIFHTADGEAGRGDGYFFFCPDVGVPSSCLDEMDDVVERVTLVE